MICFSMIQNNFPLVRKPIQIHRSRLRMFVTQQLDMKVAILANDAQKEEWLSKPADNDVQLIWLGAPDELLNVKADAYFDLYNSSLRAERFSQLNQPVFINSVIHPLSTVQTLPNRIIHPTLQTEVSP